MEERLVYQVRMRVAAGNGGVVLMRCRLCNRVFGVVNGDAARGALAFCSHCLALPDEVVEAVLSWRCAEVRR